MNGRFVRVAVLPVILISVAEAEPRNFRFGGPEVTKLDWNAKCMVAEDLNGDGKVDLAVVNPERARIEILYRRKPGEKVPRVRPITLDRWEPDLDDAPYLRETVSFDGEIANIAFGDLDLDGLIDLVYGGDGEGVLVRFREKDASWSEPLEVDANDPLGGTDSLLVRDLEGDGVMELIVFSEEGLERISFDGRKPKGGVKIQKLSTDNASNFQFVDYNGDGSDDLLYLVPRDERALRTLRWSKSGFLAETSHPLTPSHLSPSLAAPFAPGELAFATVDGDSGEAVTFRFGASARPAAAPTHWKPRIHNLFAEKDGDFLHAVADFDGDGFPDLVAAAPKEAELRFLRGRKDDGFDVPVAFPFLRGVSAMAAGDFDGKGKPSLLVASHEEGILGVSRLRKGKSFGFPEPLPIEDEAVAMATADFDGDGRAEAAIVTKKKYDYRLVFLQANEKGVLVTGEAMIDLDGLERDPSGLLARDLDGDGDHDLLVLSRRDPALLLLQDEDGEFHLAAKNSLVRKSILQGLEPSKLGWGDLDGDGREDLLVGGKGFVRAVAFEDGELKVIDQFNARSGDEDVRCPRLLDLDADSELEALLYDPSQGVFQVLERAADDVFRYARTISVGEIELRELTRIDAGKPAKPRLLAFGSNAFWSIPLTDDPLGITVTSRHETDLKDVRYSVVVFGDFDADGDADILALDSTKHLIEFLRFAPDEKAWESVMHFRVFAENMHYRGRKGGRNEPRELLVDDLDGDGKVDFALLVHDRLLTYLQD